MKKQILFTIAALSAATQLNAWNFTIPVQGGGSANYSVDALGQITHIPDPAPNVDLARLGQDLVSSGIGLAGGAVTLTGLSIMVAGLQGKQPRHLDRGEAIVFGALMASYGIVIIGGACLAASV